MTEQREEAHTISSIFTRNETDYTHTTHNTQHILSTKYCAVELHCFVGMNGSSCEHVAAAIYEGHSFSIRVVCDFCQIDNGRWLLDKEGRDRRKWFRSFCCCCLHWVVWFLNSFVFFSKSKYFRFGWFNNCYTANRLILSFARSIRSRLPFWMLWNRTIFERKEFIFGFAIWMSHCVCFEWTLVSLDCELASWRKVKHTMCA